MAYGSQPRQTGMARQELLVGGQPEPAHQVQSVEEMNTRQVMQHAVDTHKETTASAKRSLQVKSGVLVVGRNQLVQPSVLSDMAHFVLFRRLSR